MAHVDLKVFTHELGPGPGRPILSKEHVLSVPEEEAQATVARYYGGDGHTSVHADTLARYPAVG